MRVVQPAGWPAPRGYVNGVVVESTRAQHLARQISWDTDRTFGSDDLVSQFGRALENVLAVVAAAGGTARTIVSMTVYVTDMAAYRASTREIGRVWRERMGDHYPAMALVGVAELVEPRARVEIQAVAELPDGEDA